MPALSAFITCLEGSFGNTEHVAVDLEQFGQRAINVRTLLFEQSDLFDALSVADRQSAGGTARPSDEHLSDFGESETKSLAAQNKCQALAVFLTEDRGLSVAPCQQTFALVEA